MEQEDINLSVGLCSLLLHLQPQFFLGGLEPPLQLELTVPLCLFYLLLHLDAQLLLCVEPLLEHLVVLLIPVPRVIRHLFFVLLSQVLHRRAPARLELLYSRIKLLHPANKRCSRVLSKDSARSCPKFPTCLATRRVKKQRQR